MEFLVDTGEGFVVSEDIERKDWPVDYIAVDAIYTPIRKVSYTIQDTMVGRMTDFDKLNFRNRNRWKHRNKRCIILCS